MDQTQKRQIVLTAVAATALGAGSYVVFLRGSGPDHAQLADAVPAVRRVAATQEEQPSSRKPAVKKHPVEDAAPAPRREPIEEEDRPTERKRSQNRSDGIDKPKKTIKCG